MPVTTQLFAYGLRSVLGVSEETASQIIEVGGQVAEASGVAGKIITLVLRRFTDHSQTLPLALSRANERAWQALAVSLAGDGLLERIKSFFSGPAPQALQEQVKAFLAHNAARLDMTSEHMRRACLSELHQARKKGHLAAMPQTDEIARQAARYRGLNDPGSLLADARQAAWGVADALGEEYPNLAGLLRQGGGEAQPSLLVAAFAHFFRREVETNEELARGLTFDLLRKVAASQESALGEVGQALVSLGGRFDDLLGEVLEQLGRMEAKLDDIRGRLEDLARRNDVQRESSKSRFQITITNEREQALARALLEEVRKLPPEAQSADLLTLLGDVLRAAGRFKDAQESYTEASKHSADRAEKAATLYKAYLTALEQRRWEGALQAIKEAATLEPQRYAPFPLHQYQVKRILGAGGFGAVFLCQDRYMGAEVVVKGLYNTDMERSLEEAFREAQVLRHLSREHPSIIGVQYCSYADEGQTRPYIVMDYFPGVSLQAYLDDLGEKPLPLEDFQPIAWQIAVGMKAAHGKGVFHRDLKPDNVLVRRVEDGWQVRIIDFGLAIKTRVVQVSTSVPLAERTLSGESAAGTARYASPEQMGELPGVKVGPYSDVYAFGKLCCYALFRETEPLPEHWTSIPTELMQMLSKCLSKRLDRRYQDFEPVLAVLERLDPAQKKREEGEQRLRELVRQALERKQGQLTQADLSPAKSLCKEYGVPTDQANVIIREERQGWQEKAEQQEREAEGRRREAARLKREREEAERRRVEQEQARREEGERRLALMHREALDRSQGKHTADVTAICREYAIPSERADALRQEVWHQWQKDQPAKKERQAGEVVTNSLGMKFAWCPPGSFLMGRPASEAGASDELPQHRVTLTQGFFLGIHQVTQAQWQAVMGNKPSEVKGDNRPVENVSWLDCEEFCRKLGERDGKKYRLPTEAEWEYACRAGTTTEYHTGNGEEALKKAGWYGTNSGSQTHPVGEKEKNAWGLFDMHGNVWEWCLDGQRTYSSGDISDPQGPQGKYDARVLRGGSWHNAASCCRAAGRGYYVPAFRFGYAGCRVLLCLD